MSGKPNKKPSDVIKNRQEYLDNLTQTIDNQNQVEQAVRLYKETAQVMPISQMKDTRSTSEQLMDVEKLKINFIKDLQEIADPQFAQVLVQRLIQSPLNIDNKLFIFAAQRAPELVIQLKKLYKYGIKGDSNDAEQFVSFINKYYSDKNQLSTNTKSFMNRLGISSSSISGSSKKMEVEKQRLINSLGEITSLLDHLRKIVSEFMMHHHIHDSQILNNVMKTKAILVNNFSGIIRVLPNNQSDIDRYNQIIQTQEGNEDYLYILHYIKIYLYYLNHNIPNIEYIDININDIYSHVKQIEKIAHNTTMSSIEQELLKIYNILDKIDDQLDINNVALTNALDALAKINNPKNFPSVNPYNQTEREARRYPLSGYKYPDVSGVNLEGGIDYEDAEEFAEDNKKRQDLIKVVNDIQSRIDNLPKIKQDGGKKTKSDSKKVALQRVKLTAELNEKQQELEKYNFNPYEKHADKPSRKSGEKHRFANVYKEPKEQKGDDYERDSKEPETEHDSLKELDRLLDSLNKELEFADPRFRDEIERDIKTIKAQIMANTTKGHRPKGHGLDKPKAKMSGRGLTSVDYTKGIQPSPRYIQFGRYVINNKKLNDNVISLRRNKGSQISSIPSYRGSANLGNIIKTIVGGGNPSFEDLNKLTEEEKKYLYKVSQEADIFDKIKIPTPSKDQEEKDIHQFNVMKGEIMAGNDSKELVNKFKLLLLKLSRQNILPKNQVSEIMEELLEMGY